MKYHNELIFTNDKEKKIPKEIKYADIKENCCLITLNRAPKHLSEPVKLLTGYELSIKDIGQLTRSPIRQSSCENYPFVTVGDIQ